ncbi:MAG: c-type cytochrome [Comamonas sp.]
MACRLAGGTLAALLTVLAAPAAAQTAAGVVDQKFVASKNCLSCHSVQRKIVGPAFKDIAAKYADHPEAAEHLAEKIRKGGAGVWGPIPMPANPKVNEAEARQLAEWVLATPPK